MKESLLNQTLNLGSYQAAVQERMSRLAEDRFSVRLWRRDPSLWKKDPKNQEVICNGLGWLDVIEKMEGNLEDLFNFVSEVRAAGFRKVVLMGMGGSSLAPLVLQRTFTHAEDGIPLIVLDTTDPATILRIEREVPLGETLFIVASKSGTTPEDIAFNEYFYARVRTLEGKKAGDHFVAITDPDTPLAKLAKKRGFRRIFLNFSDIGGRYSALSYFGLVPAALTGIDVTELLTRARRMMHACMPSVPIHENPGILLGAIIGELAFRGRDKVTFLISESIATLGMWLEQLLAESTGKEGKGVLPVVSEPLGSPSVYGDDRLFIYIQLKQEADRDLEASLNSLRKSGHPIITIQMDDRLDLGQEFFRWEIATATVGAVLGINAFDQPNVQESKDNTNLLLTKVRQAGRLTEPSPDLSEGPLGFYGIEGVQSAREFIEAFFGRARHGDYIALHAYLPETPLITEKLQALRLLLRDRLRLATTVGYAPRFLHSTGQYHKGGPNKGLFLQLTADEVEDVPIPGAPYTFGIFKHAQALGDLLTLHKHSRRIARVHLGPQMIEGLEALIKIVEMALP